MPACPIRLPVAVILAAIITARADDKITFNEHVQPALANTCGSCHNPDKKKGGLDLTTVSAILAGGGGGAVVDPGNPGGSRLLKILRQESEPKMPPDGPKLDEAKVAMVEKWIAGGLLESKDSKPAARKQSAGLAFKAKAGKPDGPLPMPAIIPIEPVHRVARNGPVVALAASPWAPLLAVGGECQVSLYHLDTLHPLGVLPFPEGGPYVLRFSGDGRWLLAAGGIGAVSGKVIVWEVATGRRRIEVGKERDAVLAADIRPDLSDLAMGGAARKIKFYKSTGDEPFQEIKKHTEWMTAAAYSPDGVLLATGDRNGGVQVWESDGQAEFHTLRGHEKGITSLAWRPDGNLLATASEDGTIRFWDMNSGNSVKNWPAHGGGVLDAQWSQDGQLVSGGRDKKVKIWKSDGALLKEFGASQEVITRVAFAHDGKRVVSGDFNGVVAVWDLTGRQLGSLPANPPGLQDRIAADTTTLAGQRAKLGPLESAWQVALAAQDRLARERDAVGEQLAAAEKRARESTGLHQGKRAIVEKSAADLSAADNALKEFAATLPGLTAAADNAAAALAGMQRMHGEATAGQGTATTNRDAAKLAIDQAKSARDADPANPDLIARYSAADAAMVQAEAAMKSATDRVATVHAAMQAGVAARDAAQAAVVNARAEITKREQTLESLRARLATATKEAADAAALSDQAGNAVAPLAGRKQEIDKQLPGLAKAEMEAKAARDAVAETVATTANNLRRWQAEPLLLDARKAIEASWAAEQSVAIHKTAIDTATAVVADSTSRRDAARQAVLADKPWAKPRLFLAQAGVNFARRQLAATQAAAENAENSLTSLHAHAKALTNRFTRAVEAAR